MKCFRTAFLCLFFSVTAVLYAQQAPSGIVDAQIISDVSSAAPNKPFRVGVLFKIKPEWHIYWKNPGESGFATTVKWSAAQQGVKFGELQYPAPLLFEMPGPLIAYGYDDEVLLFSEVTVPESAGKQIEITANTRWLMCSDRCIPGKKELKFTLPVGEQKPADAKPFDLYARQVPAASGIQPEISISKQGKNYVAKITVPVSGKQLVGQSDKTHRSVYFFPYKVEGFVMEAPVVSKPDTESGGLKAYSKPVEISIGLQPETDASSAAPRIGGVLVYQPVGGEMQAVEVPMH
jgi:thiol:disulfide interchange protein DsbD